MTRTESVRVAGYGPVMDTLTGTATFSSWDEEPGYDSGAPVPRLAHATVVFAYDGDLVGTSTCQYVLHYTDDAGGVAVGIERLDVRLGDGGPEGAVALHHETHFGAGGVDVTWSVVPGSGTGALAGLSGTGGFSSPPEGKEWTWRLEREG